MEPMDAIRVVARSMDIDEFARSYPQAVVVLREVIDGDMHFAEPGDATAQPRPGNTLAHVPRGLPSPRKRRPETQRKPVPIERYAKLELPRDARAPRLLLGRERWCEIQIADFTVSAEHCRLYPVRGTPQAFVEDAGSRNGTARNAVRLQAGERAELVSGDEIMVGRFVLLFLGPWDFHRYLLGAEDG